MPILVILLDVEAIGQLSTINDLRQFKMSIFGNFWEDFWDT